MSGVPLTSDITGYPLGAVRTLSPSAGTFTTPVEQRGGSALIVNYQLLINNLELHIPGPKYANASGSRQRMAPLSRSDPVQRFVRSRQRFVR